MFMGSQGIVLTDVKPKDETEQTRGRPTERASATGWHSMSCSDLPCGCHSD